MLKSNRQILRNYLIKQLPSATAFINTDFEVVDASEQWLELFQFCSSEVFGKTIFDLFGSALVKRRCILEGCFEGRPKNTIIDSYIDHNNDQIWIEWQFLPWYDEHENIVGAIVQNENVTQRIVNRQKLEKLEAAPKYQNGLTEDIHSIEGGLMFKTLIDNLPLNVYIKDVDSKRILVNKSECEYLGFQHPSELIGKNDFDIYPTDTAQISRDEDLAVMRTLEPILGRETINRKKDGIVTSFLTSKMPLVGENGIVKGLVGISLDISDLKQKELELRDLINVTSLQNKKLVDFAHIISHNLRSHAANFAMLLEFLQNEVKEPEREKIVEMLITASDNLLETLDNLNEVVAISSNTNIEKKPVSLSMAINKVVQNLSDLLKTNHVKIECDIADGTFVNVVPDYLDNILSNFISNGVKYKDPLRTPVLKLHSKNINGHVVLSIEDNGLGIDLSVYGDKLFGMYKTFHNNKDARGIGLYITKNQIEAMNGKVGVESEVGVGTKFEIYFDGKS